MINKEFLNNCTDEQINHGVAWLMARCECIRNEACFSQQEPSENNFIVYNVFDQFNPCKNPNDIMPIAFANGYDMKSPYYFTEKWKVTAFYIISNVGEKKIECKNINPLRALSEVYILMNVGNNS